MDILIAEDDDVSRRVLAVMLEKWGYRVEITSNGREAHDQLLRPDRARIAVIDWMMPGMSGVDVVRALRAWEGASDTPTYIIMLTAKGLKENIVEALEAGANDYVIKPFHDAELKARLNVARRVVDLQGTLAGRVEELQHALDHVKTLQGILPICMHCHKIRDDKESWLRIENYLMEHADVQFSHGICSDCMHTHYSGVTGKS